MPLGIDWFSASRGRVPTLTNVERRQVTDFFSDVCDDTQLGATVLEERCRGLLAGMY
jgi:hypothetical protein